MYLCLEIWVIEKTLKKKASNLYSSHGFSVLAVDSRKFFLSWITYNFYMNILISLYQI